MMSSKESASDSGQVHDLLMKYIVSISDHEKRDEFIRKFPDRIVSLTGWLLEQIQNKDPNVSSAYTCLLHISSVVHSCPDLRQFILASGKAVLTSLNQAIFERKAENIHIGILVNLSRDANINHQLSEIVLNLKNFLPNLVPQLQSSEQSLLLALYLVNLSQSTPIQSILIQKQLLNELMELFAESSDVKLRKSLISIVRNCCFHSENHSKLLPEADIEFLVKLIYPLAGPEELAKQEMDQLPLDLQYLPSDKRRESNPELRQLLLEAILLLCSTRATRLIVRGANIYFLLREYFHWEMVPRVSQTAHNLIDILIKTEAEINVDNLIELQIPHELKEKFEKFDSDLIEELAQTEPEPGALKAAQDLIDCIEIKEQR